VNQEEFAGMDPDGIVSMMLTDHTSIDSVFEGLSNKVGRTKFGCSKSLLLLSEKDPALLLPKVDRILKLLDGENQILKWNAIAILGNLARGNGGILIRTVLPRLYGFLFCGELIAANNAIAALGKIGWAYPQERRQIVSKLLEIESADFDTGECRNIAIGKALEALKVLLEPSSVPAEVIEFAHRQAENKRRATARKAESFLRRVTADTH